MSSGRKARAGSRAQAEQRFAQYLRSQGLRVTAQRRAVLGAALATEGHFEADELHRQMRETGSRTSKATVYRTLELLVSSGVLRQVSLGERHAHYEHAFGHQHHDHLICVRCGRVMEFTSAALERMQEEVCRRHHFTPLGHRMRITGLCQRCSRGRGRG